MLECSFFISHGLVWLYEIELYHMGKNNRNLDLVLDWFSPFNSLLAY